ncbi:hypothetical protein L2E82_36676 [Cichorium intybus]|uniref:Uncharacterized protein n=1 Tax=Cichorium intybus TaxID=13427 RepID=A0ACB9ACD8_CICIN|nr:hypothetical protein L2E82_36676 [Cichorium intybus]
MHAFTGLVNKARAARQYQGSYDKPRVHHDWNQSPPSHISLFIVDSPLCSRKKRSFNYQVASPCTGLNFCCSTIFCHFSYTCSLNSVFVSVIQI